jgi:hypothetical protein
VGLDRLTDRLDRDEEGYYTQQRDALKKLLAEYREERETLSRKLIVTTIDPMVVPSFQDMGQEYRETLETSDDFTFWRGLVDDLDITGIIGIDEEGRRYIDFIVFGKRKREYFDRTDTGGSGFSRNRADTAGGPEGTGHHLCVG